MRVFASLLVLLPLSVGLPAAEKPRLENQGVRLEVDPSTGSASLLDKSTGIEWNLGSPRLLMPDKSTAPVRMAGAPAVRGGTLSYKTEQGIAFQFKLAANPPAIDYSFDKLAEGVTGVLLLDKSLSIEPGTDNYCCDVSDCRRTEAGWRHGQWWAFVQGVWMPIPRDKELPVKSIDG